MPPLNIMKKSSKLTKRDKLINNLIRPDNKRAIRKVLDAPQRDKNKKIVKNKDGTNKKTSNRFKVFINPKDNTIITGTSKQIADKLGLKVSQINYATKNEKVLQGYIPLGFNKSAGRTNFINNVWKEDKIKKVEEKIPINDQSEDLGYGFLPPGFAKLGHKTRVNKTYKNNNKKYGVSEDSYNFGFSGTTTADDVDNLVLQMWAQVKKERKLSPNDKVRVVINDPNLGADGHRNFSLRKVKDFNPLDVVNLDTLLESNENFAFSEETTIDFITIDMSSGSWKCGAKNQSAELSLTENLFNRKSLIQIKNQDNMCLARCIVLGMRRNEFGAGDKIAKKLRETKLQGVEAKRICDECGVDSELMCGIDEIKIFENKLDIQINVIDGDGVGKDIIYPSIEDENYVIKPIEQQIYLYKHNKHFDLINTKQVAGFFGKHKFCYDCKKCYTFNTNIDNHKLSCKVKPACRCCGHNKCKALQRPRHILNDLDWIKCDDCNRSFSSLECFNNHKIPSTEKSKTTCESYWKCLECNKSMPDARQPRETHVCGEYECKNCKMLVPCNHRCFMRPKPYNKPNDNIIYYDFESDISGQNHIVNFSISQYQHSNENIEHHSIDEFCKWAISEKHKDYTFIAHNAKGYDCKFIMNWIICNTDLLPQTIYAGSKIMVMKLKKFKIRFIDSYSFLTMPLSALPNLFGLKELAKGHFPHWFNKVENQDYVGVIPPMKDFGYKNFSVEKKKEFVVWWCGQRLMNKKWSFKDEMRKYCISDVDILKRSCMTFRQLYLDIVDIDPFTYITIAGVCMAIFRYKFLMPEFEDLLLDNSHLDKKELNSLIVKKTFEEGKIAVIPFDETEPMREGFYGGRTNACKLLYTFDDDEVGHYKDITSLYPTVNFYDEYPKGQYAYYGDTEFLFQPDKRIQLLSLLKNKQLFGIIKCDVVPPKDLYHPVLPRKGEKLIFDLEDKTGTWATPELNLAIDEGYEITNIHHCWLWNELYLNNKPIKNLDLDEDDLKYIEMKNKSTFSLFKGYVSTFLKIKQESSDYPDWVKTEADKDKYIDDYFKSMGIKLDKHKITKNKGLRAIAKLCLNSLWGKFGQNTNLSKTEYLGDKAAFIKLCSDNRKQVDNWTIFDNGKMEIKYTMLDEFVDNDFNTSLPIAIFTTSHARCRLYAGLKLLGLQVLYFDTDSIIYSYKEGQVLLEDSDVLGGWTDELEGGLMIKTFASGGPKNYSYQYLKKGKEYTTTKIKGHTLNAVAVKTLNHQSVIKTIQNRKEVGNWLKVNYQTLKRNKDHTISNVDIIKKYNFTYDKRQMCLEDEDTGNIDTLPYGYDDEDCLVDWEYKHIQEELKIINKENEKKNKA